MLVVDCFGLGVYLWEFLDCKILVIGVVKIYFRVVEVVEVVLLCGDSSKFLYIIIFGCDWDWVVEWVCEMVGFYCLFILIKLVD